MTVPDSQRARIFGGLATSYDRWRPAYPQDAIDWLLPPGAKRVGAGTGKLTGVLLGRGVEVVAIEPDPRMLALLARNYPNAEYALAGAESLPVQDASVDAVIVGQAWHWFDQEKALSEAKRVTRPGGWLGLVWNADTPHSAWQLELARLDPDNSGRTFDETEVWEPEGLGDVTFETLEVPWQEELSALALRSRLATHSAYAVMSEADRSSSLNEAGELLEQESRRIGTKVVPFDHTAYCVRVRL